MCPLSGSEGFEKLIQPLSDAKFCLMLDTKHNCSLCIIAETWHFPTFCGSLLTSPFNVVDFCCIFEHFNVLSASLGMQLPASLQHPSTNVVHISDASCVLQVFLARLHLNFMAVIAAIVDGLCSDESCCNTARIDLFS